MCCIAASFVVFKLDNGCWRRSEGGGWSIKPDVTAPSMARVQGNLLGVLARQVQPVKLCRASSDAAYIHGSTVGNAIYCHEPNSAAVANRLVV